MSYIRTQYQTSKTAVLNWSNDRIATAKKKRKVLVYCTATSIATSIMQNSVFTGAKATHMNTSLSFDFKRIWIPIPS